MKSIKNLVQVLSTGYIFVFFSERLFWGRLRPDDTLFDWLGVWIVYSLLAFVFLYLVNRFQVRQVWPLFLAGAAFGWLAEGLVVQTAYEMLPLSLSFTGLSWHALLTVWVGWYAMHKFLHSPDPWSTLKMSLVVGLGYGLWAISWWLEPDGGVATLPEFAAYTFGTTLLVIPAYRLAAWSGLESFAPPRWLVIVVGAVFVAYFALVTVPAAPLSLILLPALLGLVYWGLRRNRLNSAEGSYLDLLAGPPPVWKLLSILALPLAACLVYALALILDLRWQTNWLLYLVTTPLGFVLFFYSLYHIWRAKQHIPPKFAAEGEINP